MKKIIAIFLCTFLVQISAYSQSEIQLDTGAIHFSSENKNIKGTSTSFEGKLDTLSNTISFEVNVMSFLFKSSLFQKHFNGKNGLESELYPKATFKGTYDKKITLSTLDSLPVELIGDFKIKDITSEDFKVNGVFLKKDNQIIFKANFLIERKKWKIVGKGADALDEKLKTEIYAVF